MNGGVEEIRNSTHNEMTHARAMWDECELEPTRTRKTHYRNKQAQLWFNPQRPRVIGCTREFPHASGHSTCCGACRSVPNSLVVTAPNLFTF